MDDISDVNYQCLLIQMCVLSCADNVWHVNKDQEGNVVNVERECEEHVTPDIGGKFVAIFGNVTIITLSGRGRNVLGNVCYSDACERWYTW